MITQISVPIYIKYSVNDHCFSCSHCIGATTGNCYCGIKNCIYDTNPYKKVEDNTSYGPDHWLPNYHPVEKCCAFCENFDQFKNSEDGYCKILENLRENNKGTFISTIVFEYMVCDFWKYMIFGKKDNTK